MVRVDFFCIGAQECACNCSQHREHHAELVPRQAEVHAADKHTFSHGRGSHSAFQQVFRCLPCTLSSSSHCSYTQVCICERNNKKKNTRGSCDDEQFFLM